MKATGIVRRLDDLGRLVIPKEIRKSYRMKEGDSIEFFVSDGGEIVLRKFSALKEEEQQIEMICTILYDQIKAPVFFIEDEEILTAAPAMSGLKEKKLTAEFLRLARSYHDRSFQAVRINNDGRVESGVIMPLCVYGDWFGSLVVLKEESALTETEKMLIKGFMQLLTRQHEH